MLSSRSQNLIPSTNTENSYLQLSTRNNNFKTPARSLKKGRSVHNENSVYGHPKTVGLTGRKKNTVLFGTPTVEGGVSSQCRLKTDKAPRIASKSTALAEIRNGTPFVKTEVPVTPGPAYLKPMTSFAVFSDIPTSISGPRISSTRKTSRLPRSSSKTFETPETRGNHWDVSDISIEASIEEVSVMEDDYDDVEYAPPTAIDPKFDPGFEMPDYREVGATLMSLFQQTTLCDEYDLTAGFDEAALLYDIKPLAWEEFLLPDLSYDGGFSSMFSPEDVDLLATKRRSANVKLPVVELQHSISTAPRSAPITRIPTRIASTSMMPGNISVKPPANKGMAASHTRIPSLSKPALPRHSLVNQGPRPTLHCRAASLSVPITTKPSTHTRTASTSHSVNVPKADARSIPASRRRVGIISQTDGSNNVMSFTSPKKK